MKNTKRITDLIASQTKCEANNRADRLANQNAKRIIDLIASQTKMRSE